MDDRLFSYVRMTLYNEWNMDDRLFSSFTFMVPHSFEMNDRLDNTPHIIIMNL